MVRSLRRSRHCKHGCRAMFAPPRVMKCGKCVETNLVCDLIEPMSAALGWSKRKCILQMNILITTVVALLVVIVCVHCVQELSTHRLTIGSLFKCIRKAQNMNVGRNFLNFWFIYNEIYEQGDYQPFQVPEGGSVIDVGGNMGLFTCWADELMKRGTMYVFEPIPDLMKVLEHNTSQCKNTVKRFMLGLGSTQETVTIDYFPNANGLSSISMGNKNAMFERTSFVQWVMSKTLLKNPERVDIDIIRLDSMAAELPDIIDFVKIDVEGFELDVLRGFGKLVSRVQVFIIEVEAFKRKQLFDIIFLLRPTHFVSIRDDIRNSWNIVTAIRNNYTNSEGSVWRTTALENL